MVNPLFLPAAVLVGGLLFLGLLVLGVSGLMRGLESHEIDAARLAAHQAGQSERQGDSEHKEPRA